MIENKPEKKPYGYWTYERCKVGISNMTYLNELQGTSILNSLLKNGWYDELTQPLIKKRNNSWNKESVWEVALKYETRTEFNEQNTGAYLQAVRKGWIDEVCSHMIIKCGIKKGESKWDFESIKDIALMYDNRSDFCQGKHKYVAEIARRKGWYDEVCSHMTPNINDSPRYIYAFIWEEVKLVYVGLTENYKRRKNEHLNTESCIVFKTIKEYGSPIFRLITETPVDVNIAGEYEQKWVDNYIELGYNPVNIAKSGSLGSYSRMWDLESIKEIALTFDNRSDFHRYSGGASSIARKNGWLEEVCSHMVLRSGQWDIFENVQKEAVKYRIRKEFARGCRAASEGAYRNGWLDILFPKENLIQGDMGYWDIKSNVETVAKKCNTKSEFNKLYVSAYKSAKRNGWLDEVCSHMEILYGKWKTIEDIKDEAKKYKSKTEFKKSCPGAYLIVRSNGWSDEVFSIYPKFNSKWGNIEDIKKESLKYKNRSEFSKHCGGAYNSALKNGWLDEVCSHMVLTKQSIGHWDIKENVEMIALKCRSKTEFQKLYSGAYKGAKRNGWFDEVCSYMVNLKNK
jgi:hypothetical protein